MKHPDRFFFPNTVSLTRVSCSIVLLSFKTSVQKRKEQNSGDGVVFYSPAILRLLRCFALCDPVSLVLTPTCDLRPGRRVCIVARRGIAGWFGRQVFHTAARVPPPLPSARGCGSSGKASLGPCACCFWTAAGGKPLQLLEPQTRVACSPCARCKHAFDSVNSSHH